MTDVSVIVPARNAAATIEATLSALAAQDAEFEYEVIVVDNASEDRTGALADAAGVRVVRQERATRVGEVRNTGVAAATGSLLAFTDADCVPTHGWLRHGVEALSGADLVQGAARPDATVEPEPFDRSLWVESEALYETASLFVRRQLFERLGGFEDWLGDVEGRPIAEDVWLGWRARRDGARTGFCAEALVHHAVVRRGPGAYIAERRRLALFPEIVARIPELRGEFLYRRVFLNRRTAAFDAAAAGAVVALVARSPLPLVAAVPYARIAARKALPWGRRAPMVAATETVADTVGAAALLRGSIRRRTLLI